MLTSRYIWVGEEASSAPVPSQHEINLLNQLKNEGGLDGGGGGVDVYEKGGPILKSYEYFQASPLPSVTEKNSKLKMFNPNL